MKVLIVSKDDYANMGYKFQESLREVGVDSKAVTFRVGYSCKPRHAEICNLKKMRVYAKSSEIIQFMHSEYFNLGVKNKRLFVFHGGSKYRINSHIKNEIFNPIVEKSIIQTGDLLGLGAKNEVWVLAGVDTNILKPIYKRKYDKIRVAHFPSSVIAKNSKGIGKVMKGLKKEFGSRFEYVSSSRRLSWGKNMKRISECDIYIDACTPLLKSKKDPKGSKYGEWGVAAIEAGALGKVVISHMLSLKKYEKQFGKCSIQVANSLNEIRDHMIKLLSMTDDELFQVKKDTRSWVEKFHSSYYMGKRLKEVVYKI
jgi:hypothetical protein